MFLLVPAYPGSPEQKAVKRLCVCVWLQKLRIIAIYRLKIYSTGIPRVPNLLVTKCRTFPGPHKHFPGPCCKPAMFKYRDKQQLLTIRI